MSDLLCRSFVAERIFRVINGGIGLIKSENKNCIATQGYLIFCFPLRFVQAQSSGKQKQPENSFQVACGGWAGLAHQRSGNDCI